MPHKINPIDFENSEGNLGVHCRHAPLVRAPLPRSSAAASVRRHRIPHVLHCHSDGHANQAHLADTIRSARATLNLMRSHPALRQTRAGRMPLARRARARTLPLALQRTSGSAR
jgi:hypothetical protein